MEYLKTEIEGVYVLEPRVFRDARGYFFESWRQADFDQHIGRHVEFIQDNESKSSYGVLRGLHYQKGEYSQAKSMWLSIFVRAVLLLESMWLWN